jgi:hypothetical protein
MVPFHRTCGSQSVFAVSRNALLRQVKGEADARIFRPVGQGEDPAMSTTSADCDTEAARNSDGADSEMSQQTAHQHHQFLIQTPLRVSMS